jgi:hypothetical protein
MRDRGFSARKAALMSGIMFFGLAALMVGSYIALRRAWLPDRLVGIVSVAGSAILMFLYLVTQPGAEGVRAFLVGLPLGAVLGAAVWLVAHYFNRQEREKYADQSAIEPDSEA